MQLRELHCLTNARLYDQLSLSLSLSLSIHPSLHSDVCTRYRKLMTTNLDSLFLCCQAALGPMRDAGGGVILNIGSISGFVSNIPQKQAAYNASKAAVHMLTKSLASEYVAPAPSVNVSVNIAEHRVLSLTWREYFF